MQKPSAKRALAAAFPIPVPAPVIRATRKEFEFIVI
jgi:hypothetical protein